MTILGRLQCGDCGVQEHQFHCVGRGWPGQGGCSPGLHYFAMFVVILSLATQELKLTCMCRSGRCGGIISRTPRDSSLWWTATIVTVLARLVMSCTVCLTRCAANRFESAAVAARDNWHLVWVASSSHRPRRVVRHRRDRTPSVWAVKRAFTWGCRTSCAMLSCWCLPTSRICQTP